MPHARFPLNLGASVSANTPPATPETVTVPDVDAWAIEASVTFPGAADDVGARVVGPTGIYLLPANAEERDSAEGYLVGVGDAESVTVPLGGTVEGDLTAEFMNQSGSAERIGVIVTVAPSPPSAFRPGGEEF